MAEKGKKMKAAGKKVKAAAKKVAKKAAKKAVKGAKKAAKAHGAGAIKKAVSKVKEKRAAKKASKATKASKASRASKKPKGSTMAAAASAGAKGKGPGKYDRLVFGGNKGDKSKTHPGLDYGASMSDELKYRGMMDQFHDGESMGKATSMYKQPGMVLSKHMHGPGKYKIGTGKKLK